MSDILVTGATGFLGKHLVEQLKATEPGRRLRLLCRGASPWDEDAAVDILRGDITVAADVARAMEGCSQVYHLAGAVLRDPEFKSWLYRVHIEGTRNICAAALRHAPEKVVVVSSSGTIAVSSKPAEHDESAGYKNDVVAEWPYYLSKIFAEKLAISYVEHHRVPIVVVNPSLILGPGDERQSSTGDIALFLNGQIMSIPLGGLNFVDVRDAAAGLIAAMRAGRTGERYLLGGPNWPFRQLIESISQIAGVKAPQMQLSLRASLFGAGLLRLVYPLAGKRYRVDDASIRMSSLFWYCNTGKARRELGFTTRDPVETLRATVDDIRRR